MIDRTPKKAKDATELLKILFLLPLKQRFKYAVANLYLINNNQELGCVMNQLPKRERTLFYDQYKNYPKPQTTQAPNRKPIKKPVKSHARTQSRQPALPSSSAKSHQKIQHKETAGSHSRKQTTFLFKSLTSRPQPKINPEHAYTKTACQTAPAIIHYIWLGGPIPPKYLVTIHGVATVAKKSGFIVNLWVENEKNYLLTSEREGIHVPGLKIRNINELYEKMATDPFYEETEKLNRFIAYVNREMVGFKNYGAASDWLRLEILRQWGGIYVDTDILFSLNIDSLMSPDALPLGFKLRSKIKYQSESPTPLSIADILLSLDKKTKHQGVIKADNEWGLHTTNDLIIALPNNDFICHLINESLKIYAEMDQKLPHKKQSLMDKKRYPFLAETELPQNSDRFLLTLRISSQLIFREFPNYITQLKLPATGENIKALEEMQLDRDTIVANVRCLHQSDLTWMKKQASVSFDINAMPNRLFAYSQKNNKTEKPAYQTKPRKNSFI